MAREGERASVRPPNAPLAHLQRDSLRVEREQAQATAATNAAHGQAGNAPTSSVVPQQQASRRGKRPAGGETAAASSPERKRLEPSSAAKEAGLLLALETTLPLLLEQQVSPWVLKTQPYPRYAASCCCIS
jgi:hypothetical protein